MKSSILATVAIAGIAILSQSAFSAVSASKAGCRQITVNGVERTMCPGDMAGQDLQRAQQRAERMSGSMDRPIVTGATAQLEVTADQLTVAIRFSEQAGDIAEVVEKLKQKRESIVETAKSAGLNVTEIEINQLDVNQRNRGDVSTYQGNANFNVSVAGFSDPLDVVLQLGSLGAQSIGQIQFSMSPEGAEKATAKLRELAEENARSQAEQQAAMRGMKLGKLISMEFQTSDRRMRSRQMTFTLSGHGRATFAPE